MGKYIMAYFAGELRPLHYSVGVMFDVNEKYGSASEALDLMTGDSKDSFDVTRYLAVRMANEAELCRRAEGHDHHPMLEEKDISTRMSPIEYVSLIQAISNAIEYGYTRELEDENEETDLGLLELRKKAEAGA